MVTVHYLWKLPILLVFIFLHVQKSVSQNVFINNCNDPLIVGHTGRFTHSYCVHACAFRNGAICEANGDCSCPCSITTPGGTGAVREFDNTICPPMASDPLDPDLTHLATCRARCIANCPGGGGDGTICGEVGLFNPPNQNAFAKICTCSCPTCPNATTTTTTPAPSTSIAILPPNPFLPLIILYKFFLYYLFFFLTLKKFIWFSLKCFQIAKAIFLGLLLGWWW